MRQKYLITISFFLLIASEALSQILNVGDVAPNFSLEGLDGGLIRLSSYEEKTIYLLFFGIENLDPEQANNVAGKDAQNKIQEVYQLNPNFKMIGINGTQFGDPFLRVPDTLRSAM